MKGKKDNDQYQEKNRRGGVWELKRKLIDEIIILN